jgi:hypothetical protein
MRGKPLQQAGELRERVRRCQLVEIIDDQEDALAVLGELRADPVGDRQGVEVGCRCQFLALAGRAQGLPDGAEQSDPELLGVLLVVLHLDDRQPVPPAWPGCPGAQQRGLAAARGGRDEGDPGFRRAIERGNKFSARNQLQGCRPRLSLTCPECHGRTRSPVR